MGSQGDSRSKGLSWYSSWQRKHAQLMSLISISIIIEKVNKVLTAFNTQLSMNTILIAVHFACSALVASGSLAAYSCVGTPASTEKAKYTWL